MKRVLHLIVLLFISINLFAQAPQKMTYQAVIRNTSNNLVVSSPVKMKISILQGGATGTSVYSELHNPTTNANGLVSIEIGEGTNKTGTFSTIDWGNGTYFLKTEADPTNGNNLSIVGTSQLLSVPYALHSGNGVKGVSTSGDTLFLDNGKKYLIPGIKDLNAPSTLNNGLVGYWPFNGNANDESGNGNNGVVNGATLTTDRLGNSSKAYGFNGSSFILCDSKNLPLGNLPRSVSFWAQPTAVDNAYHMVFGYGNYTFSNLFSFGIHLTNNFYYFSTVGTALYTELAIENQFVHYVIVYNNDLYSIYKNGTLLKTGTVATNTLAGPLYIGKDVNGGYFKGKIDELRVYNRALTQEEITYLANN